MSVPADTKSDAGSAAAVPPIRQFQIDANGLGAVTQSANLFRGSITIPINLVSVVGIGGLDATVRMLYSSDLGDQVETWNLDAPTGPLGLGWSLGYDFITRGSKTAAAITEDAFYLVADGASNVMHLIESAPSYRKFALDNYQFWDITYYPAEERWVIVKEDGTRSVFGGLGDDQATSAVQYGIKWPGANGNWIDSTTRTSGQSPFAIAWNLAAIEPAFGTGVELYYENDLAVIGGSGGLQYTVSSRLKRLVAPAVRSVIFTYRPKVYDEQVHEYQPAHVDPTDASLHAYQDHLNATYLHEIEVRNAPDAASSSDALLMRVCFDYELRNVSSAHKGDPNFFKRYLTAVSYVGADGAVPPNMVFTYYGGAEEASSDDMQRGVLQSVLYPQGGRAHYGFQRTTLTGTSREATITPRGTPRAWFADDYTVVTTYDGNTRGLGVNIYLWNGILVESPSGLTLKDDVDLETMRVSTQSSFFAIGFQTKGANPDYYVVLFHKRIGQTGIWDQADPIVLHLPEEGQGQIATGYDFAVAVGSGGVGCARVWNAIDNEWVDRTQAIRLNPRDEYALAATADYCAIASYDKGEKSISIQMLYRERGSSDLLPARVDISPIRGVRWGQHTAETFWGAAADFAVMTYVTSADDQWVAYDVHVLQWDLEFRVATALFEHYTLPADTKLPFEQSVVSGSVVGNLNHVYRFDGMEWQSADLPLGVVDPAPMIRYGSDAVIIAGASRSILALFNPYLLRWDVVRDVTTQTQIVPTVSGDYFTIDRDVYYRESDGSITSVFSLPGDLVPKSLQSRAPSFVVFEDSGGNTHVLPLKNGGVDTAGEIVLHNQRVYTPDSGAGTDLVGPRSLVTYDGPRLNDASLLHVYQFVDGAITGPLESYPISWIAIDDGYDDSWSTGSNGDGRKITQYYYDCDNVTVSPDGSTKEFASATAVYGASATAQSVNYPPPQQTPYGRSEFRYHNDRSPIRSGLYPPGHAVNSAEQYYSFLNGMLYDQTDYNAAGDPVEWIVNQYDVRREVSTVHEPDRRQRIRGAYVKQTGTRTTQYDYPEGLSIAAPSPKALAAYVDLPTSVREAIESRAGKMPTGASMVAHLTSDRLRVFPDPDDPHYIPVSMRDGRMDVAAGVSRTVKYEYSYVNGLLSADETAYRSESGSEVINRREMYFAWQIQEYSDLRDQHILSPIAASLRFAKHEGLTQGLEPVAASITTLAEWNGSGRSWASAYTYVGADKSCYDPSRSVPVAFDDWNNRARPSDQVWRITGRVSKRDRYGSVTEVYDAMGNPTATILNSTGSARVCGFANAKAEEVISCGFEPYETLADWTMSKQGAAIVRGDAHSGIASLGLQSASGASAEKSVNLATGKRYILTYWVKTSAQFASAPGSSSWDILDSSGTAVATCQIEGSDGTWAYRNAALEVPATGRYRVRISNAKTAEAGMLLVDDVIFAPLSCSVDAVVYDELYGDTIATLTPNGRTTKTLFDSLRREATSVGTSGSPKNVYSIGFVRSGADGSPFVFPANDPNLIVSVAPSGPGAFADFVQGEAWRSQWSLDSSDAWIVRDGRLVHSASSTNRAVFAPTREYSDYGVRATVRLPLDADGHASTPRGAVGLEIGTALKVAWTPDIGWSLTVFGQMLTVSRLPFGSDWLIVVSHDEATGKRMLLVTIDGRILHSGVLGSAVAGAAALTSSEAGMAFESIAAFTSPAVSAVFADGSGKIRQEQNYCGTGVLAQANLYDAIGRPSIGTKGALLPSKAIGYEPALVRTFDPASGKMTGLVADAFPQDEGYPYVRTEFYRTAQSLASKQGAPGRTLAIVQSTREGTLADDNPHIQRFSYAAFEQGQFGIDLPSDEYFVQTTIDPNGDRRHEVVGKTDLPVAKMVGPMVPGSNEYLVTKYEYDAAGRVVAVIPPAGVQAGASADPAQWATRTTYDFLGLPISVQTPDSGLTQHVYDAAGQARFSMDANGAARTPNLIVYAKYDALGRTTEEGTLEMAWDRDALQKRALLDPLWPDESTPHTVSISYRYDGDGSDALDYGNLVETVVNPANPEVQERFSYYRAGSVRRRELLVPEFDDRTRVMAYSYDNQGRPISTTYPDGSPIPTVTQRYDVLGRVFEMGTPQASDELGTFRYDEMGKVSQELLALESGKQLEVQSHYGSPGWLIKRTASVAGSAIFSQELSYTSGGYSGSAYYDGKVASISTTDGSNSLTQAFQYDAASRLQVVQDGSLTTQKTYDPNGNFATNDAQTFRYDPNTNRLRSITEGSSEIDAFEYDDDGNVTSTRRSEISRIEYSQANGLTRRIEQAAHARVLEFRYDSVGTRALKQVLESGTRASAKLYVRGDDGEPMLECMSSRSGTTNVQYLYGPEGLLGMHDGSRRYALVRDHLGSVRHVVDQSGAVVATFDYSSFGVTVSRGSLPDIIAYRYTAQEFDSETQLYNYEARLYDPKIGRFVAVDPKEVGDSPYVYVLNNPLSLVDPTGEEPLTAFLIIVIVSAIIGAVAGAVTYVVTHQGNFEVDKFFLYAAVGLVAGAAGGAAGYGAGLLATTALATIGVSTSTSIASGVIVGAAAGAADGVVSSSLNQIGVNLIEQRPAFEGVGTAAATGAIMGAAIGGGLGLATGIANRATAMKLTRPTQVITERPSGRAFGATHGAAVGGRNSRNMVNGVMNNNDVLSVVAHGGRSRPRIRWAKGFAEGENLIPVAQRRISANNFAQDVLQGGNFNGGGVNLDRFCWAGRSGVARTLANELKVPVRAANVKTTGEAGTGLGYIRWYRRLTGGTYRTYYPSKLKTGWVALFGY